MAKKLWGRIAWTIALALTAPGRADVVPGDKITADNVDKVKDLVSPGLEWCIRHGFPITITDTKRIEWPRAYREATERYSGQVRLGADGLSLQSYVAGQPRRFISKLAHDSVRREGRRWLTRMKPGPR